MEQNNYQGKLQKATSSGFDAKATSKEVINGIDFTGLIGASIRGSCNNAGLLLYIPHHGHFC